MTLVIPIRRVLRWITALYKFLYQHLQVRPALDPIFPQASSSASSLCLKFYTQNGKLGMGNKCTRSRPPRIREPAIGSNRAIENMGIYRRLILTKWSFLLIIFHVLCILTTLNYTILHVLPGTTLVLSLEGRMSHCPRIMLDRVRSHPLGGGYTRTIQPGPTSPRRTYSMSSPELGGRTHWRVADPHDEITQHRRISQFFPQPRSDSPAVSLELLSSREISSSPDRIPPVSSIEQPTELPRVGASSEIHTDDVKIPPELNHRHIYPVVPELFFHESNGDGLLWVSVDV